MFYLVSAVQGPKHAAYKFVIIANKYVWIAAQVTQESMVAGSSAVGGW